MSTFWKVDVFTTNSIPKVKAGLEPRAARYVAKAALDIQGQAQRRAPVDTGRLRSSIQAVQVSPLHWEVRVNADYGIYVEYGTRHAPAQPYLNPAVDVVRPAFLKAMAGVVG